MFFNSKRITSRDEKRTQAKEYEDANEKIRKKRRIRKKGRKKRGWQSKKMLNK